MQRVADQFKEVLVKQAEKFPPTHGVNARVVEASLSKLKDADSKGATFLVGGPAFVDHAALKPSVILGVTKEMEIYNEEAFGPSVSLFIARDDAHAIELANDTPYGLNAAIHTLNLHRALEIAKELEVGQVHINNMTPHDERKCEDRDARYPHLQTYCPCANASDSNTSIGWSQRQWLGSQQRHLRSARVFRDQNSHMELNGKYFCLAKYDRIWLHWPEQARWFSTTM